MTTTFKNAGKELELQVALSAIRDRGEELTVRGLRDQLGGGSFATLSPVVAREKTRLKNIEVEEKADQLQRQNALLLSRVAHLEELLAIERASNERLQRSFDAAIDRAFR